MPASLSFCLVMAAWAAAPTARVAPTANPPIEAHEASIEEMARQRFDPTTLPIDAQQACHGRAYCPVAGLACAEAFADWREVYCASLDADFWSSQWGPESIFQVVERLRCACDTGVLCPQDDQASRPNEP